LVQWQTAGSANWSVGSGATGTNTNLEFYNHNTASTNLLLNYSTGNFLIGGTIDGGQKLQVNGTALLGTDNASLGAYFDYNGGISGNATLWLRQTTKSSSTYTLTGGGTYTALNAPSGGSIYLRINNSDALTLDSSLNTTFAGTIAVQGTAARIYSGTGSPEGVVTAAAGSIYLNLSGGNNTTFYVKQSGSGNTGWNAK